MLMDSEFLERLLKIYDYGFLADYLNKVSKDRWHKDDIRKWNSGNSHSELSADEFSHLNRLLPAPPTAKPWFKFSDLFAGIGGIRKGFDSIGGECVFTSERDKFAVRTYMANFYFNPTNHIFNKDIREITQPDSDNADVYQYIDNQIPDHDVLLAGFPCQPFSLAGVSKKKSLGYAHGFECKTQGTLFFDIARIIAAKKPSAFVLENVKNLKGHDGGRTFKIIIDTLTELGYWISDLDAAGPHDPKIIDGKHFLPQHRERIVLVGFRKDLNVHEGFTLKNIRKHFPDHVPRLRDLLDEHEDPKYILSEKLWEYLYNYARKHRAKGNGFGYGLADPKDTECVARTLSARYHKDGSEILIDRGWNKEIGEREFRNRENLKNRPRRLSPRECARLMGFDKPGESLFRIPVSDTQAYRQFGNSVVVPVFEAVAKLMKPHIRKAIKANKKSALENNHFRETQHPYIRDKFETDQL